ncbi:MAG: DNA repair protein RadC [Actinomycetota bacterium]|nr:DNA repair protein RadC [Actinomycetota bacterium]
MVGDESSAWTHGPSSGAWRAATPTGPSSQYRGTGAASCTRCAAESLRTFLLADIAERSQIASPEDAAGLLVPELVGRDRERCVAALLDTKHRLVALATISVGSVDHTFMSPREVLRDALLANASALVLAHNHPSGDPQPSHDDELVTGRLVHAGDIVGVAVLDHLVVGGSRWVSMARCGLVR